MKDRVPETVLVERRARGFPRSPLQLNGLGESDAELLRLPGTDLLLAVTTDAIVEEIEAGLYRDPGLIGWMTVIASASDLGAVGADPLGILVSQTLPASLDSAWEVGLQAGIRAACEACGLFLLGGDTSSSESIHLESTAVGTVPSGQAMLRSGAAPGDALVATGPLGLGSAFAAEALGMWPDHTPTRFRPTARLREGGLLRSFASCCMDTSDGALATLDELMLRSGVGFRLTVPVSRLLHRAAADFARTFELPSWVPLAGPHGEFELVCTIPQSCLAPFRAAAKAAGIDSIQLGVVKREPGLILSPEDGNQRLPTGRIRALAERAAEDTGAFLEEMREIDRYS